MNRSVLAACEGSASAPLEHGHDLDAEIAVPKPNAIRSLESALLRSWLFCVTTVSIVCTIKAPVPVRAEDG